MLREGSLTLLPRHCSRVLLAAGLSFLLLAALPCNVSAAFTEDTNTEGEIPIDLNGVWLMASTLEFPNGEYTTLAQIYRITHVPMKIAKALRAVPRPTPEATEEEGKILIPKAPRRRLLGDDVDLMLLDVEMPEPIASEVDKSLREKKPWHPTADEIKLLAANWSTLKAKARSEYGRIEYRVVSAENFDTSLKIDESTRGSKVAIIANQTLIPGPKSTGGNVIFIWGIREVQPDKLSGTFVRSHMVGTPFPVAITSQGKFDMYKIGEVSRDWEKKADTKLEATSTPAAAAPTPQPSAEDGGKAE